MWNDFTVWLQSPGGARVLQTAIIPALAILVAGVLAALIARAAITAAIRRSERAEASSAVAALVAAARAAADPEAHRGARRRAARLRTEADVRTRLLPLPGANVAADWSSARIDALHERAAEGPVSAELDELRDHLIRWVRRPERAKRIFAAAVVTGRRSGTARVADRAAAEPESAPTAEHTGAAPAADHRPADASAAGRAAVEAEPLPAGPAAEPQAPAASVASPPPVAPPAPTAAPSASPAPAVAVASAAGSSQQVPAWQRTRAGERLQQERGRGRGVEPLTATEESVVSDGTAPVPLQHAHRAPGAPAADADEAVRLEAHQSARHSRPGGPQSAVAASRPGAAPASDPSWLDDYDDEAHVTQNLDLKTPPPVAAAAVRDRGPGEDLVPRS